MKLNNETCLVGKRVILVPYRKSLPVEVVAARIKHVIRTNEYSVTHFVPTIHFQFLQRKLKRNENSSVPPDINRYRRSRTRPRLS